MWPNIETDILGDLATVLVDSSVYPDVVVFKAAYWMTDQFYVFIERNGATKWRLELRNKPDSKADLQHSCAELCNKLLDFRLRDIVNKETLGIREALVKRAFVEGVPKPGLEGALSDETHLNVESQS